MVSFFFFFSSSSSNTQENKHSKSSFREVPLHEVLLFRCGFSIPFDNGSISVGKWIGRVLPFQVKITSKRKCEHFPFEVEGSQKSIVDSSLSLFNRSLTGKLHFRPFETNDVCVEFRTRGFFLKEREI